MPVPKGFSEKKAGFPKIRCDKRSFRVKILDKDRRLIICCPRGGWNKKSGACRVGTRAVAVQTRRKGAR
jgi:hypothetical protein